MINNPALNDIKKKMSKAQVKFDAIRRRFVEKSNRKLPVQRLSSTLVWGSICWNLF